MARINLKEVAGWRSEAQVDREDWYAIVNGMDSELDAQARREALQSKQGVARYIAPLVKKLSEEIGTGPRMCIGLSETALTAFFKQCISAAGGSLIPDPGEDALQIWAQPDEKRPDLRCRFGYQTVLRDAANRNGERTLWTVDLNGPYGFANMHCAKPLEFWPGGSAVNIAFIPEVYDALVADTALLIG